MANLDASGADSAGKRTRRVARPYGRGHSAYAAVVAESSLVAGSSGGRISPDEPPRAGTNASRSGIWHGRVAVAVGQAPASMKAANSGSPGTPTSKAITPSARSRPTNR